MSAPDETHPPLAAAVLAGGRGRRLGGVNQAALPLGDTRIIDRPLETLRRLLARSPDPDRVIPRSGRGYEPLCAIYGKRCAAPCRERIERGDLQASVLPQGIRIEEIGPEALATYDPHGLLFVNVNTPHDYERVRSLIELGMKPMHDRITGGP